MYRKFMQLNPLCADPVSVLSYSQQQFSPIFHAVISLMIVLYLDLVNCRFAIPDDGSYE